MRPNRDQEPSRTLEILDGAHAYAVPRVGLDEVRNAPVRDCWVDTIKTSE